MKKVALMIPGHGVVRNIGAAVHAAMVEPEPQPVNTDPSYHYTFTVFTPTHNRAHTLSRVYESLKRQTYRDFEWLIVDNGSIDNTPGLVEQWQKEAKFPIRYIYQNNKGKHMAYNLAAREAKGQLFICLDSDDACVAEALASFKYYWDSIPKAEQDNFFGVECPCQDQHGKLIGSYYPSNPTDTNFCEMRYRLKVKGERWGFQRTDILRQFPFPEVIGQNLYVAEMIVWSRVAKKYKIRCVNECLRIYYVDSGADQLTKSNWVRKNPFGFILMSKSILDTDIDYFQFSPSFFVRNAINYSRYCFYLKIGIAKQFTNLNSFLGRLLWFMTFPLGYMLWFTGV